MPLMGRRLIPAVSLWWRRLSSVPIRVLCAAALGGVGAMSIPAVPSAVLRMYAPPVERFRPDDAPAVRAIVLLGAGTARVVEAARVYHLLNRPWVISSGGARADGHSDTSAETMRAGLVALGVPVGRILLESSSATTHDEALLVAPMLRRLNSPTFVLVTSRMHMPRAAAVFRAQGLEPVPAASRDETIPRSTPRWVPGTAGLKLSRALGHELLGFGYYGLRGWLTDGPAIVPSVIE
jgi:uncharacterized SAM-binding protein YcdF (DUF218 family)